MAKFGVRIEVNEETTEQGGDYPELPAGVFKIEMATGEVRRKYDDDGNEVSSGFNSSFDVVEPEELAGRKIFNWYTLTNPNPDAERIGRKEFSALRRAMGYGDVDEEMEEQEVIDEMRLVPFIVTYGMGKDSKKKNPDGTPKYPAEMGIRKYWFPDKDDAPPIGVTGTPANDNKPTARVVAKPATVAAKPAGSKPWQKSA